MNGERPIIPEKTDLEFKQLIEDSWAQDPETRPTFEIIIERLNEIRAKVPEKVKSKKKDLKSSGLTAGK